MASNKVNRLKLIKETGNYCWYCRKKINPENLTLHHIIPLKYNSSLCKVHFALACKKCHTQLHQMDFGSIEYMYFTLEAMDFYREKSIEKSKKE